MLVACTAAPLPKDSEDDYDRDFSASVQRTVYSNIQPVPYASFTPVQHSAGVQISQTNIPNHVVHSGIATHNFGVGQAYTGASFVPSGYAQYAVPSALTYNAGEAVAIPAFTQLNAAKPVVSAVNFAAPTVSTYNAVAGAGHSVAVPSASYFAVASAPAIATTYNTVAAAPAIGTIPSAITYQSEQTVELPAKELTVAVQHKTVHVPVEQRVHYGIQNFVTGSKTTVHKPHLSAPAIAAPSVFATKNRQAAPEVTVHHSEVTVEKSSPNYVNAPYDAGVVVEHATPEFKQVDVPTPVDVPQPVPVAQPYAVPVPHHVKVKSSITPVVNVDVHSVKTENVITPVEYAAHHHVAAAPVVATGVPVVGQAVNYIAANPAVNYQYHAGAAVNTPNVHLQAINQRPVQQVNLQAFSQIPVQQLTNQQVHYGAVNQIPSQQIYGQQVQFGGVNQIPVQYISGQQNAGQYFQHQANSGHIISQGTQITGTPTAISYSAPVVGTANQFNQGFAAVAPTAKVTLNQN